ncbi:hypothetical protein [Gorillibacterium sp. sgz500922]|uniref:hypothetical protein n=1 Tax=Gorillibacterium sp. sgz500922 TaxID=3446694 RepID=UPI003F67FB10
MNAWEQVAWAGQLADLKESQYRTLLLASALAELLIGKGLATRDEIAALAAQLERADLAACPQPNPADPA